MVSCGIPFCWILQNPERSYILLHYNNRIHVTDPLFLLKDLVGPLWKYLRGHFSHWWSWNLPCDSSAPHAAQIQVTSQGKWRKTSTGNLGAIEGGQELWLEEELLCQPPGGAGWEQQLEWWPWRCLPALTLPPLSLRSFQTTFNLCLEVPFVKVVFPWVSIVCQPRQRLRIQSDVTYLGNILAALKGHNVLDLSGFQLGPASCITEFPLRCTNSRLYSSHTFEQWQ